MHQWLHDRCSPNNCIWIAKDDGIYLKNNPQNHDELIHKWELGWKNSIFNVNNELQRLCYDLSVIQFLP